MIVNSYTSHIKAPPDKGIAVHCEYSMIFIAGIHPRARKLDNNPRSCPLCGGVEAYLKRVDHYLSIFFIPIFPVRRGKPAIICERCGGMSDEMGHGVGPSWGGGDLACRHCGRALEREFTFCPYCGERV